MKGLFIVHIRQTPFLKISKQNKFDQQKKEWRIKVKRQTNQKQTLRSKHDKD